MASFFWFYFIIIMTMCSIPIQCLSKNTFIMSYEEGCEVSTTNLSRIVLTYNYFNSGVNYNNFFKSQMFRNLQSSLSDDDEKNLQRHVENLLIKRANELRENRLKNRDKHVLVQVQANNRKTLEASPEAMQRDLLVATLECLVAMSKLEQTSTLISDCSRFAKASAEYLEHLHVEIVEDSSKAEMQYLNAAHRLPCVASPIEMNTIKSANSVKSYYPNDFNWKGCYFFGERTAHQWGFMGPKSQYCSEQYGSSVTEAWTITTGSGNSAPTVAIVDTGCYLHPDIDMNFCKKGESCAGYDFADDDDDPFIPTPTSLHGTSVTSVVAAKGNNRFGIAGVCWSCKIMCIKVMTSVSNEITKSSVLKAYNFLVLASEKGIVKLSNHSYNGFGFSLAEFRALKRLQTAGHLLIASAGNDACNVDQVLPQTTLGIGCINNKFMGFAVPVSYDVDNILVSGAVQRHGRLYRLSNWGTKHVHVFAAGESIPVASNVCKYRDNGGVRLNSGTSFSSPLVAGVAALLLQLNPSLSYREIKSIIMNTARKYPHLIDKCASGGILDAYAAVKAVAPKPSPKYIYFDFPPSKSKIDRLCSLPYVS